MSNKLTKQDVTYRDLYGDEADNRTPKGKSPSDVAIPALTFVKIGCTCGASSYTKVFPENLPDLAGGVCIETQNIMEL